MTSMLIADRTLKCIGKFTPVRNRKAHGDEVIAPFIHKVGTNVKLHSQTTLHSGKAILVHRQYKTEQALRTELNFKF
jgi:hypothetical protein